MKSREDLSFLLALIEATNGNNNLKDITPELEQKIIEKKTYYQRYLNDCSSTMSEAVKLFKMYDKDGLLKKFFEKIGKKHYKFDKNLFSNLMKFAMQAYDNGTYQDAYSMLSFISACFPLHNKVYLYLGKSIENTHGNEVASEFYKNVTSVFKDPDLLFLAANCEMSLDNTRKAYEYLSEADKILDEKSSMSEQENDLKSRIEEILNLLNQIL